MLAAGIKTPAPLEELENHLREEIERRMQSGLDPQQAFEIAGQQIGQARAVKDEFNKIERKNMKRSVLIASGMFAVFFGPGMILPALAKHRDLGIWNYNIVWPIAVGAAVTLIGVGIAIIGFKKRKA